ncbi:unnamed protein product [Lampetra planeri]
MVGGASLLRALCCLLMSGLTRLTCHLTSLTETRVTTVCVSAGLMDATSLGGLKLPAERSIHIKAARAHDFLTSARPKRNVDPRWYRADPDFQSYYRFYSSIGHLEGLYEIDRIRMLYQQMRHLELTYGPDASSYQNVLGVHDQNHSGADHTHPTGTSYLHRRPHPIRPGGRSEVLPVPPIRPAVQTARRLPALGGAAGSVRPAHQPGLRAQDQGRDTARRTPPTTPRGPAPKKSAPATPPATRMEYDCDPYWDPDCLIDHPPRLIQETAKPQENAEAGEMPEEELKEVTEEDNTSHRPSSSPSTRTTSPVTCTTPLRYGGGSDPDSEQ